MKKSIILILLMLSYQIQSNNDDPNEEIEYTLKGKPFEPSQRLKEYIQLLTSNPKKMQSKQQKEKEEELERYVLLMTEYK